MLRQHVLESLIRRDPLSHERPDMRIEQRRGVRLQLLPGTHQRGGKVCILACRLCRLCVLMRNVDGFLSLGSKTLGLSHAGPPRLSFKRLGELLSLPVEQRLDLRIFASDDVQCRRWRCRLPVTIGLCHPVGLSFGRRSGRCRLRIHWDLGGGSWGSRGRRSYGRRRGGNRRRCNGGSRSLRRHISQRSKIFGGDRDRGRLQLRRGRRSHWLLSRQRNSDRLVTLRHNDGRQRSRRRLRNDRCGNALALRLHRLRNHHRRSYRECGRGHVRRRIRRDRRLRTRLRDSRGRDRPCDWYVHKLLLRHRIQT